MQIKLLEMKTKMSEMKNIVDGINGRQDIAGGKVINLKI